MTQETKAKRLAPGLYEITTGGQSYIAERNDGHLGESQIRGWWYSETPDGRNTIEAPTLREMKEEVAQIGRGA